MRYCPVLCGFIYIWCHPAALNSSISRRAFKCTLSICIAGWRYYLQRRVILFRKNLFTGYCMFLHFALRRCCWLSEHKLYGLQSTEAPQMKWRKVKWSINEFNATIGFINHSLRFNGAPSLKNLLSPSQDISPYKYLQYSYWRSKFILVPKLRSKIMDYLSIVYICETISTKSTLSVLYG